MLSHDGMAMDAPSPDMLLRAQMVAQLEKQGRIRQPAVAAAMRAVGRHHFIPHVPLDRAYADDAIVTKWDADKTALSSASQPAMIAIMLEQLDVQPGMHVLEIGAGTGYNAALLAHLVGPGGHVTSMDIDDDIAAAARAHLLAVGLGADRVTVGVGDGAAGWAAAAPYDRIILTVGAWDVARAWFEQLAEHGRLVLPLALRTAQVSVALDRVGSQLRTASLHPCGFIRLRGAFAGPEVQLTLDDAVGLRLLAEPPLPSVAQITTLLALPPRILSLPPHANDGLRYLLAFTEPNVVSLFAPAPHRTLGSQALGILTPEGDSACFLALHGHHQPNLQRVEYGAATAGIAMEAAITRWGALGHPTLSDWSLTLHPHAEPPPAKPQTFWLPKAAWVIEARVGREA
ncbi:MAG: methyltransferase domain-containing protein [Ktedonobacterales bacterium]|nr:methyltransferase domain-containing protein [Ktedonobacterales bacterium]